MQAQPFGLVNGLRRESTAKIDRLRPAIRARSKRPVCDELILSGSFEISLGGLDPAGREFLVGGVTRGDHYRLKDDPAPWTAHWEVPAEKLGPGSWVAGHAWTLGDPATLAVPGAAPEPQPPPLPPPGPQPPPVPRPVVDPPVPGNLRVARRRRGGLLGRRSRRARPGLRRSAGRCAHRAAGGSVQLPRRGRVAQLRAAPRRHRRLLAQLLNPDRGHRRRGHAGRESVGCLECFEEDGEMEP